MWFFFSSYFSLGKSWAIEIEWEKRKRREKNMQWNRVRCRNKKRKGAKCSRLLATEKSCVTRHTTKLQGYCVITLFQYKHYNYVWLEGAKITNRNLFANQTREVKGEQRMKYTAISNEMSKIPPAIFNRLNSFAHNHSSHSHFQVCNFKLL